MICSLESMRAVGKLAAFSICGGDNFAARDETCDRQSYSICRPHQIVDKAVDCSTGMRREVRRDANLLGRSRAPLFREPPRSILRRHRHDRQLPKEVGCESWAA